MRVFVLYFYICDKFIQFLIDTWLSVMKIYQHSSNNWGQASHIPKPDRTNAERNYRFD